LPAIAPLATDTLHLRVWPNQIDFNLHLNNARYLSIMDYARVHLLARGGVLTPVFKARWAPVVGAVWISYRRSLPLWASYELATRLVAWDNRWFYMEQIFTGKDGLVAVGWVKGALVGKSGAVNPQQVMDLVEPGIVSPPIPEGLETLNDLTREKLQAAR
jgi:acyl-CoA thioesterase FadM